MFDFLGRFVTEDEGRTQVLTLLCLSAAILLMALIEQIRKHIGGRW